MKKQNRLLSDVINFRIKLIVKGMRLLIEGARFKTSRIVVAISKRYSQQLKLLLTFRLIKDFIELADEPEAGDKNLILL